MMKVEQRQDEQSSGWLVASTCFVALSASLANMLNHGHYGWLDWATVILLAGCGLIAVGTAFLVRLARPRLSFIFIGLFCAWFADLNASLSAPWFLAIMAVAAGLARYDEKATVKLAGVIFATVLVFQIFEFANAGPEAGAPPNEAQNLQDPKGFDRSRPAIIHLILDAYMGIEGMQVEGTAFGSLHAEQAAFFKRHGFTVFPQAYGQHVKTVNALPHIFSYGEAPLATTSREVQYLAAPRLRYFSDLDRQDYRISAATPSFVDLCAAQPMTHCTNYNRSLLGDLDNLDLDPLTRARIIGHTAAQLSQVSGKLVERIGLTINDVFGTRLRRPYNETKLFPITAMKQLDSFTADLSTLKPGQARILHLLVPHDPYVFRPDCSVKVYGEWLDEHGPGAISAREAAYADQVKCLQRKLHDLMAALDRTPAGRSAIVVLHGDHGARTIDVVPFEGGPKLSAREMAMAHSTLFAVRLPGREAEMRYGRYAVSALMRAFADGKFQTFETPPDTPARAYLMDADWIPGETIALPDFRSALTTN